MKLAINLFIFSMLSFMFFAGHATAQRRIIMRTYGKDSVAAGLNDDYYLTEDSCTQILRYSRFDRANNRFIGHFKDVRKDDTTKTLAEGDYNEDGLKEGEFVSYYLSGGLRAKGSFKDDAYTGVWSFYYEDGSPELMFNVTDGIITITDVWDHEHKKSVDKGKGNFKATSRIASYYWYGRLLNGRPDGVWNLYGELDLDQNAIIMSEHWNNGKFLDGGNFAQAYSDSSRIILVNTRKLNLTHAEKLRFSTTSCDVVKFSQHSTDAKYPGGDKKLFKYFDAIADVYMDHFIKNRKAIPFYSANLFVTGEIDETGHLVNLTSDQKTPSSDFLIEILPRYIPQFQPALAYGKPIRQKITFSFDFGNGTCKYGYQLQPIELQKQ